MKRAAVLLLAVLAACRPPASDRYVERMALDDESAGPTVMATSPDTTEAIWADGGGPDRAQIRDTLLRDRLDMLSRRYLRELRRAAFVDVRV